MKPCAFVAALALLCACSPTSDAPSSESGAEGSGESSASGSDSSSGSSTAGADSTSESGSADEGVATTDDGGTSGDGDGDGDGTCTPPGSGWTCNVDSDCAVAGDCCSCTAYNPSQGSPGNCGGGCGQSKCDDWGVTAAACIAGECVAVGASCNQDQVFCDSLPPACAADELPGVAAGCWSGACIPTAECDWVPDCGACSPNQICMTDQRGGCDFQRCVNPIPECDPSAPLCSCLGSIFCEGANCSATADTFTCG